MSFEDQIYYWTHMLDESKHDSYYKVYMQENPKDQLDPLVDSLLSEFMSSLKKDNINIFDCIIDGVANMDLVEDMQAKIKHTYVWDKIKAQEYAAIITRMTALLSKSKNQRFNESNEIGFDDVSHFVSRRTIESCLDIICHNTNVLEANNAIMLWGYSPTPKFEDIFKKNKVPTIPYLDPWKKNVVKSYVPILKLYSAWGSYAKGTSGEKYVCDSDNGPGQLKKILDNVEYAADTIDLIVTLNKCLDIVHFRSDLAAAFIEGGQKTCAMVSNLPDKLVI